MTAERVEQAIIEARFIGAGCSSTVPKTNLDRDEVAFRFVVRLSGGALPCIPMMQTADTRQRNDDTRNVRTLFHWPRSRWVLPERQVRAVFMVVADVGANESA